MTVRFVLDVPPPPMVAAAMKQSGSNTFTIKAVVRSTDSAASTAAPVREFRLGYQVVEYPHTTRRHVLVAPEVTVKALDVSVKPNLSVGYIMGVGDEVPAALEQLGVKLVVHRRRRARVGRLVPFRRDRDRRARLRAAQRPARV